MRWCWRPSEDREGRTTSRRRATSRCLRSSIQPASCMPRCSLLSGSASPRWRSAGRASPFSRPSCSTCSAGDAPCRQPRPLASLVLVPRATPAPLSRTSSSSAASCATSLTDTHTSTRRSWKTSSTAARSPRQMAMARSALMPFWPRRLARLNLAAASVHDEHLTVHVASRVGGQEENRRGDLAGYADPAHRVLRQDTVEDLLVAPQRFGESSFDQAWRGRVGNVVDAKAETGPDAADARDVDDGPAVRFHRDPVDQPRQDKDPAEVHLEGLVPCAQLGAQNRPKVRVGGGVVDQDVDPGEALHGLLDEPLQVVLLAG